MILVGVDLHTREQSVAMLDRTTGEVRQLHLPRWTPQNRPYVDGAKPAIERAPKRECCVPRFRPIEQVSRDGPLGVGRGGYEDVAPIVRARPGA